MVLVIGIAYLFQSPDLIEELGIRYVLEGSVHRSGDQVRINAQLIDAGADIEKPTPRQSIEFRYDGSTPLILTAVRGSTKVTKLLLTAGADVNAHDLSIWDWSALHWAAEYGHTGVAKLLIDNGLPVDVRSRREGTPLFNSVRRGYPAMIELLEQQGSICTSC